MLPFSQKYAPRSSKEIIGQEKQVSILRSFIQDYKSQKKKAILIYGPPGSGKTSSVYAIANEFDMEIIEVNASDCRNSDKIDQVIGNAIKQQSLFFRPKLILIDEVDGIAGREDRGGLNMLIEIIGNSHFPIAITANDPWNKKFNKLRKNCEVVEFSKLDYSAVKEFIRKVCRNENIHYEEKALSALSRRSDGDLRGALIDLQTLSSQDITYDTLGELSFREKKENVIKVLQIILKTTDPYTAMAAANNLDEDLDEIRLWLEENIPNEYTEPKDLERAFNILSLTDIYSHRIRRNQYWRLLAYISNLLTAGIALSKRSKYEGMIKLERSKRLLTIWIANRANGKRDSICEKLAAYTNTSKKRAMQDTLPYLKRIFSAESRSADKIAEELELNKEEAEWLRTKGKLYQFS